MMASECPLFARGHTLLTHSPIGYWARGCIDGTMDHGMIDNLECVPSASTPFKLCFLFWHAFRVSMHSMSVRTIDPAWMVVDQHPRPWRRCCTANSMSHHFVHHRARESNRMHESSSVPMRTLCTVGRALWL